MAFATIGSNRRGRSGGFVTALAVAGFVAAASLPVVSAAPGEQAPAAPRLGPRVVRPGDTLFRLAMQHGTTVTDLARWNGLDPNAWLVPGRALRVPLGMAVAAPAPGENVPAGVEEDVVLREEPEIMGPPVTPYMWAQVQAGDTVEAIAARHGLTSRGLMAMNGLTSGLIYPGDKLRVPRAGVGPEGAVGPKRIEVDVSDQRLVAWQGSTLVWNFVASTGMAGYPTRRGTFAVQSKIDNAWSSAWQLWMPHWLGIYWAGGSENGIHALPIINGEVLWGGLLGSPVSYGCVVLDTADAEKLFRWADMGTPVVIED